MGKLNSDASEGLKVWAPSSKLEKAISYVDLANVFGSKYGTLASNLVTTKQIPYANMSQIIC